MKELEQYVSLLAKEKKIKGPHTSVSNAMTLVYI